jgi:hypothetical protein
MFKSISAIILLVGFYGHEMQSIILKEKRRLGIDGNRILIIASRSNRRLLKIEL